MDNAMNYNFDEIIERSETYSEKWAVVGGRGEDFRDPAQRLPFQVADMDFTCPEPMLQALHQVVEHRMFGYSYERSKPYYIQAIIDWYQRRYGCSLKDEWIIYSNGSIEGVNGAIRAFSSPGDGIIIARPVYGHFTQCIEEDTSRKVVDCHLINQDGYYTMDWEKFEILCKEPTNRVFILCSPANPVGRVWTKEELKRIIEICKRNHVILVSDEVHCDILSKGSVHHPILNMTEDYSNIIMVTAINKSFNTAGLVCANVIIPDDNLRGIYLKEFGFRFNTPFSIAALVSAYQDCDEWLEQVNVYIEENIDYAIRFLKQNLPKVKVCKPEGTYILWLDFSEYGLSPEELHERIYHKANLEFQDGTVHDPIEGGQFQRMCIPCPRPMLEEALTRLAKVFS